MEKISLGNLSPVSDRILSYYEEISEKQFVNSTCFKQITIKCGDLTLKVKFNMRYVCVSVIHWHLPNIFIRIANSWYSTDAVCTYLLRKYSAKYSLIFVTDDPDIIKAYNLQKSLETCAN